MTRDSAQPSMPLHNLPTATRQLIQVFQTGSAHAIALLVALGGLGVCAPALAQATSTQPAAGQHVAAGTRIDNTAEVSFAREGGTLAHVSASTSFLVDQLLDVTVTWQDGSPVLAPAGASNRATRFKLTNTGNGDDSYSLTLTAQPGAGEDFSMAHCRLFLDSDANGLWTDADQPYVPGSNDPALAAGTSTDVLAVCDYPTDAPDQRYAQVQVKAVSTRFSGTAGDYRPSKDVAGLDLVLGSNGNQDSDKGTYQANAVTFTFDSTQQVIDSAGGSVARSGSTILYTLFVRAHGSASGGDLIVTDPMPEHTTYVPGTLVLDDNPIGDSASDGDAGDFAVTAANAITVNLGDMAGSAPPHVIAFKVTID